MEVVVPSNRSLKKMKKLPPPVLAENFGTKIDYPGFEFEVTYTDPKSGARLGKLTTPHGTIETPN